MTNLTPTFPRRLSALLVAGCLAIPLLAGCSALTAQNPSTALTPVNAVADGQDDRVMLKGYDVVAYFTQGRHAMGSPQIKSVYQGVTFRFAALGLAVTCNASLAGD